MPRPPDDDAPRWEPPAPSAEVPRWEAERAIPRWTPPAAAAPVPAAGLRPAATASPPAPGRPVSALARPFVWWSTHPWIVVWLLVLLIPGVAVLLRFIDESASGALVAPVAWAFGVLSAAALVLGALASARRSALRMALGLGGALTAAALLLWPVTHVTLGRTACPRRAGPNLGASIATAALQAWRERATGDAAWQSGRSDASWNERARGYALLDYQLVESGCWERVAPVDGTRTWHEFRVTVRRRDDNTRLSKTVLIHAATGAAGWKLTGIDGPLP